MRMQLTLKKRRNSYFFTLSYSIDYNYLSVDMKFTNYDEWIDFYNLIIMLSKNSKRCILKITLIWVEWFCGSVNFKDVRWVGKVSPKSCCSNFGVICGCRCWRVKLLSEGFKGRTCSNVLASATSRSSLLS